MFEIGWSEMLLIAILAIIFIGPRDIPMAMRVAGRFMGKARLIAREFRASLDEVMRETELDELRRQVENAARPLVDDDHTLGSGAERSTPEALGADPPAAGEGAPATKPDAPAAKPEQERPRQSGQDGSIG
jgi:sec-independent protein translocase protein TatB